MTDSQVEPLSGHEVEYCQRRLLSLRSRIEFLWPQLTRGLRGLVARNGLSKAQEALYQSPSWPRCRPWRPTPMARRWPLANPRMTC